MTRVLFLVGCDHLGYKMDPRLGSRCTLWTLFVSKIQIDLPVYKFTENFSYKQFLLFYCLRNSKGLIQLKHPRSWPPPPPVKKAVTVSGQSKFRKKNWISENYDVQSTVVPSLVKMFCHQQKRPISGLRWCMARPQGLQEGVRIFDKKSSPLRWRHCSPQSPEYSW